MQNCALFIAFQSSELTLHCRPTNGFTIYHPNEDTMKLHTWMISFLLLLTLPSVTFAGQENQQENQAVLTANYQLASRFAPYKLNRLIYSTTTNPHWIKGSDRFWYEWETSEGKSFYLVDPAQGTKTLIFDNDRIAAELTRLTKAVSYTHLTLPTILLV